MYVTLMLCILFIALALAYKWKRRKITACVNKCNGPPTVPFLGHALLTLRGSKALLNLCLHFSQKYSSPVGIWLFHKPYIAVYTPEDIQLITSKCLEKDEKFSLLGELIGDGILTARVDRWKRSRRMVSSAFNMSVLSRPFLEIFNQRNRLLIHQLQPEADKGEYFDLWPYIFKCSFNTILETAMGHSDELDDKDFVKTRLAFEKSSKLICKRIYQPWLQSPVIFNIYLLLTGNWNIMQEFRELPMKILEKRRKRFMEERRKSGFATNDEKSFKNMIDILLNVCDVEDRLTNEEITDEVTTILFAGSETNAITTTYTLLMLAIRQDIQDKVYAELCDVFGDSYRMPTIEDLAKLNYLEQCVKETLRRVSVAPLSSRVPSEDLILSTGHIVPAGVSVITAYIALHYDKNLYPNPFVWNPANFDADKVASRPNGSFLPFGYGPRHCVGYKYGMLAMKTQICFLLRTFKLSTDMKLEDLSLDVDVLVRLANEYRVKLDYRRCPS